MKLIFVSIAAFLLCSCSAHSISENEFPSRAVTVGGHEYKFRIYVPVVREPAKPIPVMLFLHGSGMRGDDNQSQLSGVHNLVANHPERFPFIIVMPQCGIDLYWAGEMMDMAVAALDQTVKEFNGDPDRLYIAGYSMGGFGVWQTAVTYPNKFAALVPIAGGIKPQGPLAAEQRAMLSPAVRHAADANDPYEAFASAIGNTPVWVFHGGADDVVLPEGSRQIVETLREHGNPNVKYTEFENVGHGSMEAALNDPALHEWLAGKRLSGR